MIMTQSNDRMSKNDYYLSIAMQVLERSTCLRRQYGAVIVKADEIIATGYNGSPRGMENCSDRGFCYRNLKNIPSGQGYEDVHCSVHAEQNAIISAGRSKCIGATLYLVGYDSSKQESHGWIKEPAPCSICMRMIINAGISKLILGLPEEYKEIDVAEYVKSLQLEAKQDHGNF